MIAASKNRFTIESGEAVFHPLSRREQLPLV
jgi:hypothetical protein